MMAWSLLDNTFLKFCRGGRSYSNAHHALGDDTNGHRISASELPHTSQHQISLAAVVAPFLRDRQLYHNRIPSIAIPPRFDACTCNVAGYTPTMEAPHMRYRHHTYQRRQSAMLHLSLYAPMTRHFSPLFAILLRFSPPLANCRCLMR